jgi:hypothetical protein
MARGYVEFIQSQPLSWQPVAGARPIADPLEY